MSDCAACVIEHLAQVHVFDKIRDAWAVTLCRAGICALWRGAPAHGLKGIQALLCSLMLTCLQTRRDRSKLTDIERQDFGHAACHCQLSIK